MAIITISRQTGSFGNEIARAAADKLGYDLIEKVQISEILSKLGFSVSDIDKLDEKKPSLWQTLTTQKEFFAHTIQAAVCELAARNNVVIVGRGGQVILNSIPGTLHVRIIAPFVTRVSRLMAHREYVRHDAERIIQQSDHDSSGYLRTYFDANWESSELYDLVINTGTMTVPKSVEIICSAVDTETIKKSPKNSRALLDLALNHKANAVLLEVTGGGEWLDLSVVNGVATLSGLISSTVLRDDCDKALLNIQGITSVRNQVRVQNENTAIF